MWLVCKRSETLGSKILVSVRSFTVVFHTKKQIHWKSAKLLKELYWKEKPVNTTSTVMPGFLSPLSRRRVRKRVVCVSKVHLPCGQEDDE